MSNIAFPEFKTICEAGMLHGRSRSISRKLCANGRKTSFFIQLNCRPLRNQHDFVAARRQICSGWPQSPEYQAVLLSRGGDTRANPRHAETRFAA